MGEEGRIATIETRLDKIVESISRLSSEIGSMQQSIKGLKEIVEHRINEHEAETEQRLTSHGNRIEKLECRVNDLEDVPGMKARERWEQVYRIGWRVLQAVAVGGALIIIGMR